MLLTTLLHLLLLSVSSVILGAGPDLSYLSGIWEPSQRGTIKATVPKEYEGRVTFDSSNVKRATVSEASRENHGDSTIITLKVMGVEATPADEPQGDAKVRGLVDEKVCASAKILVAIPKTQTHAVGPVKLANTAGPTSDGSVIRFNTKASSIVTITIRDQFGLPLDAVYDGEDVVTEEMSDRTGIFTDFPDGQIIVRDPDNRLTHGVKLDKSYMQCYAEFSPSSLRPEHGWAWTNGDLEINGARNIHKLRDLTQEGTAVQKIRVHGHVVTPNFRRTKKVEPKNQPPIPYTVVDEPA